MKARYIFMVMVLFSVVSCSRSNAGMDMSGGGSAATMDNNVVERVNQKLPPVEYVRWVEDEKNGLKREKTLGDMIFSAQYKPESYIVCEEERKESIADTVLKKKLKELTDMQYYDLKIEIKDGQGELLKYGLTSTEQYQERINYFSFGMQKDIQLVDGNDTLPCLLYHYERVYDVAPYGTFILGFAKGKNDNAGKTLLLFDKGFNKGIVKFYFEGKDIKYLPQLQTI